MTIIKLVLALFLSFLPGYFGRMFSPTAGLSFWYSTLNKSVLNPPAWVFPVAWNLLYLALGVALFLVLMQGWKKYKNSIAPFTIHMILNGLWSFLFFGLHMPIAGMINIIALIIVGVWMYKEFSRVSKPAGYLVWPYIAWLCFALYLNSMIVFLN